MVENPVDHRALRDGRDDAHLGAARGTAQRTDIEHNATVTLMRTTAEECAEIGRRIAEKLNTATGPATLFLPLRGVSMIDAEGQPFYDADADHALFASLKRHLASNVRVVEIDAHINDSAFAGALADELLAGLRWSVPVSSGLRI